MTYIYQLIRRLFLKVSTFTYHEVLLLFTVLYASQNFITSLYLHTPQGVEAKERSTQTARKTDKSDRKPDNSTRHATSVGVASSVGGAVVVQVDCPDDLLWKTNRYILWRLCGGIEKCY